MMIRILEQSQKLKRTKQTLKSINAIPTVIVLYYDYRNNYHNS